MHDADTRPLEPHHDAHHAVDHDDIAPGRQMEQHESFWESMRVYLFGYLLSLVLTVVAFLSLETTVVWGPGIPVLLLVLAVAQMGVHLVFFLHIGTGHDSTNNVLALAFGILIVGLLVGGSMWIMYNLDHNMMNMHKHLDPEMEVLLPERGHGRH